MFVHVLISFSSHCSLVESLASGHHCHTETAFSYQQQKASESGVRESLIPQWLGKRLGGGKSEPGKLPEALYSSSGCFTVQLLAMYTWAVFTWKEHMSVSSTLIMAPALSNSPQ